MTLNKKIFALGATILLLALIGAIVLFWPFNHSKPNTQHPNPSIEQVQNTKISHSNTLIPKTQNLPHKRGKLSIIIVGLGLFPELTDQVLNLPDSVMLGYYPQSPEVNEQIEKAISKGFDVYMMCPMEPVYYPQNDPGPNTLLTGLPREENLKRLDEILNIFPQIKGIVSYQGSLFMTSLEDLTPIIQSLKSNNKTFIDTSNAPQSKTQSVCKEQKAICYRAQFQLDQELSADALKKMFKEIEKSLETNNHVVVFGFAYPITIEAISSWIKNAGPELSLEKLTSTSHSNESSK
ncbi:MAG: divergent polysaccharide deacetylase family protein [Candidatus Nucleicultricaceae bacterium]